MPRVLNKRTDVIPPDAIYVGRPSKWGNPYKIGRDGSREEVVDKYKRLLLTDICKGDLTWDDRFFTELRGKDLVCWCAPLACHGDVLLELANRMPEE